MKLDWLSALIEASFSARNLKNPEDGEDDAIEILPEMLAELEADNSVSSKIAAILTYLEKNGRGVFLLQKKARDKREHVRRRHFEVVPGNQINGLPNVKRRKLNLDLSMIQPRHEEEEDDE